VRNLYVIVFVCVGSALLATLSVAQLRQSSGQGGAIWVERQGPQLQIGQMGRGEVSVDLPPGATIRQIEPISRGWMAAGRLPDADGTDLFLIAAGEGGAELLPVPARGTARYRGQPVLFLADSELVGLAWAAGDGPREFAIWAAEWQEGEWSQPDLISPVGPGSQVAPAGAILEDGSWLLAWTAYDGQDSEVVWSRRTESVWTAPEPIDGGNEVPDVTPDVVPIAGGAMAVWSWFDGNDYRLKSARWLNGDWRVTDAFGGRGSGEPRLFREKDRILLLYPSVEPPCWTVVEFDLAGRRQREATVFKETYERPLLLVEEGEEGVLRWSTEDHALEWRDTP